MSKVYSKNDSQIKTKVGEVFSIELESNPTTGFKWEASFDADKVKLKDKKFESASAAIGSGGKEILTFESVSEGDATIRLDYKRSWESGSIESVEIKAHSEKS